ncbi:unnamed protein product, partial [Heterosigma akashiwo]
MGATIEHTVAVDQPGPQGVSFGRQFIDCHTPFPLPIPSSTQHHRARGPGGGLGDPLARAWSTEMATDSEVKAFGATHTGFNASAAGDAA